MGLHMLAIIISKGTKCAILIIKRIIYACNLFQKGPNMLAIIEFFCEIRPEIIITWLWDKLDAIATIYSPFYNKDCKYIRSSFFYQDSRQLRSHLWPRLQAYLDPIIKIMATICSPPPIPMVFSPVKLLFTHILISILF